MKPRVIAPYKVLAVALVTAACGKTTADPPAPVPEPQPALSNDEPAPKLLTLRTELDHETRESAFAKQAHYRPLCDKDGYPLVGNLNRKGFAGVAPSELCADVRAKKPSST